MFFKNFFTREVTDLLSNAATVGLHLVSATFIGLAMGYYLDKWLDTRPVFTLIMLIFGVAAGFKNVYQEARRIQRQQSVQPPGSAAKPEGPPSGDRAADRGETEERRDQTRE